VARGRIKDREDCFRYPYQSGDSKMKNRDDKLFYRFLRDLPGTTRDPKETFNTWTYGIPQGDSAYLSIRKYEANLSAPDSDILQMCKIWCKRHFACMGKSAVNWDYEKLKSQMNLSTSPGFPYNRSCWYGPGYTDKRAIFDQAEYALGEIKKLRDELVSGNFFECYVCTAKEELRKVKKVKANEFRTFTGASWRNTALGNILFGEMTAKFYANAGLHGYWSRVGDSMYYGGWDRLYRYLNALPNAFEGDFSNYDAIIHADWIEALGEVFYSFYDDRNKNSETELLTRNYFRNIVYGQIVCPNGELYSKFQGNPSGSSLTIITNTMIHYMLFCYAWIKLGGKPDYSFFHLHVRAALCGDDSLWTCSNDVVSWFNIETVAKVWNSIGLIMKPEATKRDLLKNLSFLSHGFEEECGMFFPVPNADKVISSMLYKARYLGGEADNLAAAARWSLLKASALRMTSWMHKPTRYLLQSYIDWLHQHYRSALHSQCQHKGIDIFSYDDVMSVYKSDDELAFLFAGSETGLASKEDTSLKEELGSAVIDILADFN